MSTHRTVRFRRWKARKLSTINRDGAPLFRPWWAMPDNPARRRSRSALASGARRGAKTPAKLTTIRIEPTLGYVSEIVAPAVVVGRYVGMPVAGPMRALDEKLGGWLETAVERGILG